MANRPPTPLPVKRALRQEACFGCCICGNPILQYHHIIPYASEHHFRVEDMMTLCPTDHVKANHEAIDEAEQRLSKAEPFNCVDGKAQGPLYLKQQNTDLQLGSHVFKAGVGDLLRVDGDPLIRAELSDSGVLLLSLWLYDSDDHLVATILENEWISDDPHPWDIDYGLDRLTIRSAPRSIALMVDVGVEPVAIRGAFWRKGRHLRIDREGLHVDQAHFVNGGDVVGFVIEMDASHTGTTGFRLVGREPPPIRTARRDSPKVGRNDLCPCGSGKKFKRCHGT
jgi:hypothetical protein